MGKIEKIVIITGYHCNNRCQFCVAADKRQLHNKTTEEIVNEMVDARKRNKTYLELIGGELTIRPDAVYLIKIAKGLGFEFIAMATNGRMLSYKDFARKLIAAGITDIIFSIHGHNAKLHDSLTRSPGSFKQLIQGLENVKKAGLRRIGSNTTIVKQNYRYLPRIGKLILEKGIRNSEFIFADPTYGGVYNNFIKFMPRISEAAVYIRKCLDLSNGRSDISHWHIRYVPVCYFKGYEGRISEVYEKKTFHTEHLAPDFQNFDVEKSRAEISREKPEKCRACKYYSLCEGIWKEYIRHYGIRELTPIVNQG
ncbi:MAG: radical SAM protein [Candidatus Omnitrophica bacterium]|nr:radical SAM protein [Candidatus Omnitrophota bacterium]